MITHQMSEVEREANDSVSAKGKENENENERESEKEKGKGKENGIENVITALVIMITILILVLFHNSITPPIPHMGYRSHRPLSFLLDPCHPNTHTHMAACPQYGSQQGKQGIISLPMTCAVGKVRLKRY